MTASFKYGNKPDSFITHEEQNVLNGSKQKKIGWQGMEWIHLAQCTDRWQVSVQRIINVRAAQNENFLRSSETTGFSRITQFCAVSCVW